MNPVTITLKNYRCFADAAPVTFKIGGGITAFVGPSNSGKSTALKSLYELREVLASVQHWGYLGPMAGDHPRAFEIRGIEDPVEVFNNANDRPLSVQLDFHGRATENHLTRVLLEGNRNLHFTATLFVGESRTRVPHGRVNADGAWNREETVVQIDGEHALEFGRVIDKVLYIPPFRNAITEGGGSYYDRRLGRDSSPNGTSGKPDEVALATSSFRTLRTTSRIFSISPPSTSVRQKDTILHAVVDGRPYRMRELGAGLTQFIVAIGNAAIKRPRLVLIDEPEIHLHPPLQMDFLLTLGSYASDGLVFATHSLGLARASADFLYSTRREDDRSLVRLFEKTTSLAEFSGAMSFSGFSELGCNCILLAEGVTEVKTIQQFLRRMRRDHQVVVLPLGGDQFIGPNREQELEELKRVTPNVVVLIDSERRTATDALSPARQAFLDTCARLEFRAHATDLRALENYFPERALQASLGDRFRALGPFEKLGDHATPWSKNANWRIAREMTEGELDATDVGRFLRDV